MNGPLDGIRVVDVTTTFLGPYCTFLMAQMGADIIKIEAPSGDITRGMSPGRSPGMGWAFLGVNRGKRSVVLDLRSDAGREALARLVATADVFVHNMRPAAAAKLGIDYETVAAWNQRVVYCAAYGFAERGPYDGQPAYDDIIQAVAGLAALQADGDGAPQYLRTVLADKTTGLTALYGILAALLARERTGEGGRVDVSMFETIVASVLMDHMAGMAFEPPLGGPGYVRVQSPHRRPYRTLDGHVSVMAYTNDHWRRFCSVIERPDLADEAGLSTSDGRHQNLERVARIIAEFCETRTTDECLGVLRAVDVPAMPVNTLDDLFRDRHLVETGFFRVEEHPSEGAVRVTAAPVTFDGHPEPSLRPAPRLGEHTAEVLREVGAPESLIDRVAPVEPSP